MDEIEQLRTPRKVGDAPRPAPNPPGTVTLGDAVKQLMAGRVSPRQARLESVARLWSQLLPPELCRHCKLAGVAAGQLKVLVDEPCYMHELQLCSSQLLRTLQQRCPRARIKGIKLAVGRADL